MTTNTSQASPKALQGEPFRTTGLAPIALLLIVGLALVVWAFASLTPGGAQRILDSLFALSSVQSWWYVTRAAGLTSYFLVWLSTVWGLALASRIFQPAIEGLQSYDFHELLSLLGLGFMLVHASVLMLDKYLPFSVWEVLIPFVSPYRPFWVGIGIISLYVLLLVTVTFYLRRTIGSQAIRSIHLLSLLGYLGATAHGLFAGTDSALSVTRYLYAGTFLVVVFLTAHWLVLSALSRGEKGRQLRPNSSP